MRDGIFGGVGAFGESVSSEYSADMKPRAITATLAQQVRGHRKVSQSIFGQNVYAQDSVPEVVPPSWTARTGASGFGEVDGGGFEKGTPYPASELPPGVQSGSCGIHERMINWDRAWPCTDKNNYNAAVAYLNWRGYDPNSERAKADDASQKPGGVPPFYKGAWISDICNLNAPVPVGLSRPSVCEDPDQWNPPKPARVMPAFDTSNPTIYAAKPVSVPFLARVKLPDPVQQVMPFVNSVGGTKGLMIGLGVAALAIGGGAFFMSKRRKKAA